jgi:hypothetical protein
LRKSQNIQNQHENTQKVYKTFGVGNNIFTDYFEGRHQISGRKADEFLSEKLKPQQCSAKKT